MDRFNVLKKLGKGTFGTVYLCERKHNQVKIVVKEIDVQMDKNQKNGAKNEIHILRSLNHPNIIRYLDNYEANDMFYIVMDYAFRGNLYQFISNAKPTFIQEEVIIAYFTQMLMGIQHIHANHIIHRDLKSENILLTGARGNIIKIGDFGISKILSANVDQARTVIGTTNYLPPEICHGKPYNNKSDIWALGCILYEMCAQERMFEGSIASIILSIANGTMKKINSQSYSTKLQILIDQTMKLEPDLRPTADQLLNKNPVLLREMLNLKCSLGNIN